MDPTTHAKPATSEGPDPRRWKALALLCTAQFLVLLDASIVSLALPSIERDLGFTTSGAQWLVSGYLVSFGGLLLLGGRMADLVRRRRLFVIGTAMLLVTSLVCGLAWSPEVLIAFRVLQGAAAAFMSPTALSIAVTTFEDATERNRALAIWAGTAGFGATAGLLVGGPITETLGWEWTFFLSVPVALALMALSPRLLRDTPPSVVGKRTFDVAGAVSITAALMVGVYAITNATEVGWGNAQTLGLLAASVALSVLFVAVEKRSAAPLVPLTIFRQRHVTGANLVMVVLGMLAFAFAFPLTLYAQNVLHYSPLGYGVGTIVMTLGTVVGSILGQRLVGKVGFRVIIGVGMALMAVSCLLLTQVSANGTYFGDLFFGLLFFGPGLGAGVAICYIAALTGIADHESGLVSGINTACFQIGGALGVAIVATTVVSYTTGADPAGLTAGFQGGFAACAIMAVVGLLLAVVMFGRTKAVANEEHTEETTVDELTA